MALEVYVFSGSRTQAGKDPVYIDATYVKVDDQIWFNGRVNETANTAESLLAVLSPLFEELKETLGADLKQIQIVTKTTTSLDFIASGKDQLIEDRMAPLINAFKKWRDEDGIKFSRKTTIKDAEFGNLILADSAAALAYRKYTLGEGFEYSSKRTDKEWRAAAKTNRPILLCDKLLYNFDEPETLGDNLIYYSGCGFDKKSTSKKNKLKDTRLQDHSHIYYIGSNNKIRHMGKVTVDERRNVVILKERCELVDSLQNIQLKELEHLHTRPMYIARLDTMFGSGVGNWLEKNDPSNFGVTDEGDLFRIGIKRDDITYVFNPPRMAYMIRNQLLANRGKLMDIINGETTGTITDITDSFFYTDNSGKKPVVKLLDDVADKNCTYVKVNDIAYSEGKFNTRLVLTTHVPKRETLKALAKTNPTVKIVTYKTDIHEVSFAIVIENDEGWLFYQSILGSVHILRTASKRVREANKE